MSSLRLTWRVASWLYRLPPFVAQVQSGDCGVASLCMILRSYGRHVSLEELRSACNASQAGCTAADLIAAATDYGLVADGLHVEGEVVFSLPVPAILLW